MILQMGESLPFYYSGPYSQQFWDRINAIEDEKIHGKLYSLGTKLQNLEIKMIDELLKAEPWKN